MTTEKKTEANRENSKKSTGPKSDAGKDKASKNSIKHGVLSSDIILPWEEVSTFDALQKNLNSSLKPIGGIEELLVDRIVSISWRMKRAGRVETSLFLEGRYTINRDIEIRDAAPEDSDGTLKLKTMVASLNPIDMVELGSVFREGQNTISILNRYESALERSLYKALHELQRVQAVRAGQNVPAPVAIDVHSDFDSTL